MKCPRCEHIINMKLEKKDIAAKCTKCKVWIKNNDWINED